MMLFCDGEGAAAAAAADAMSDKRTEAVTGEKKKAVMKDKPFVPTTEYRKLYFTAAILPNCFCASGWLFK